jgi:hypothetical protein
VDFQRAGEIECAGPDALGHGLLLDGAYPLLAAVRAQSDQLSARAFIVCGSSASSHFHS